VLPYREALDGQILEEGISEAGAIASWTVAATIPNCKSYDPAFAGEQVVILDAGMREMMVEQKDVFYYITLMNENYAQPSLPLDAHAGMLRGCYYYSSCSRNILLGQSPKTLKKMTLLGSGAILTEVIKAADMLADQGFEVDVVSVTSWSELARDGAACESSSTLPWIAQVLKQTSGPIIAATDYVRAVPESVRAYMPEGRKYTTLGTDGFGRSDTRAALRAYFKVDATGIVQAALLQMTRLSP
jgi:pyruvate dehydrogenase E1 component